MYMYTVHVVAIDSLPCLLLSPGVCRLQAMIQGVYVERARLRKTMVDLHATERDILLRIFRKVGSSAQYTCHCKVY